MLKNNARNQFAAQLFTFLFVVFFFTTIAFAADGGLFQITVEKSPQNPIVGISVYLFDDNGSYLGLNQVTDSSGIAAFNLAEGTYKARADYLGYEFWSDDTLVSADTNISLPIPHQNVTLTVEGDYLGTEPIEGVPVFLFTAAGTYMNQNLTTAVNGQVVFSLPEQAYTVRTDYMAQQYWSGELTWQDATVTVPMAEAEIQVTGSGLPLAGVNIYVYTASGTYLGLMDTSDASGTVNFRLAAGNYKFRADYQSSQYWSSEETLNTGQVNPVVINTGGGVFSFTLLKEANDYLVGANCYVFNEAGTYLGMTGVTSNEGLVSFNLADGNYKFRVDYLEYQFWTRIYTVPDTLSTSLTIPHQDVTVTIEGAYQAAEPLAGVPVYLFTKAGTYMNQTQSTDAAGQVVFNLPEQTYKVRADYHSQQYWSAEFTWQDTSVTVPMAEAAVQVTSSGLPLEGINVYVFSASGVFLNLVAPTDTSGMVTFRLPADIYKFRADYQSSQYWSADETLTAGQVNPVGISTGGGEFSFTVFKGLNDHLAGISCYVFNGAGTYLGMTDVTSSEGQVTFNLADGDYKFRTDYLGYQFWSAVYTVPSTLTAALTIPHQDVTVTVEGNYQAAEPLAGVPVYLFTETGTYMNQIQSTDAAGQVVFNLPEQPYKVRADYLARQYWSAEFVWQDTALTVPMAEAAVQVTSSGLPLEGINVYVFSASGAYLNFVAPTDAGGTVTFRLPSGTYKFRADYQASQYWSSEEALVAGQVTPVDISTGGGVFSFTVLKGTNDHLAGVNCYVFNEAGTYLGMTAITSSEGLVTFNLADGNYKLRVDYLGYQFWSPVYTVPDTLTATLTVPHQDVTVTILGNYQTAEPLAGVPVYLFTEAGTYLNQTQSTDAAGQMVFNLPAQYYKIRADYLGQQFWSASFQSQDTTVTINQGLAGIHVTRSGSDVAGAKVYLFSENDAYLGWFETTDESGSAEFLLPDRSFKFRVDEGADQQWTPVVVISAGVLNDVEVDFTPIAVNISADPEIITTGGSLTLTWSSIAADSCVIEPGIGTVDVNGSISVTPSETTTYTITATGPGGSTTDSVTVTVDSPPPITEIKLIASDPAASDYFGRSVSISGDYAIVGAYGDDDGGSGSGSAYIFKREGAGWTQQAKLVASDGQVSDYFGYSVSISGDFAIVGAYRNDDNGYDSGAAYIFKREGSTWIQQSKLSPSDAAEFDNFGRSVSISGDHAIVGALYLSEGGSNSGSAYIFKREGTSWSQQSKLTASTAVSGDYFGEAVSISENYAIVGAGRDADGGSSSGSAYIFQNNGLSWSQQAKLTATDAAAYDQFGKSVSISGDYAIVGAYGDDDGGSSSGSAYIFKLEGFNWNQQAKLIADDAAEFDLFGSSVSISGDYAIVGAYGDDDGGNSSGSAYIFKLEGSNWAQNAKLAAGDGQASDYFGYSVSISGNNAIGGAYGDDDGGLSSGSAYIYSLPFPTLSISGDPEVVQVGESSTLLWSATNADTCLIEPGIGDVAVAGSTIVSPNETTTYTITAAGPGGTATDSVTINVIDPTVSPSVSIDAAPASIAPGGTSILSWSSTNAENCVIEPGIDSIPVNGSILVSPNATTTYTITATGPAGTATASVTVTLVYPPSITVIEPDQEEGEAIDTSDAGFIIRWIDEDPDDNATIALYYSESNSGTGGTLIVDGLEEDDDGELADAYVWDTSTLSEGSYYVYAVIDDGNNPQVVDYSNTPVYIEHSHQTVTEFQLSAADPESYGRFGNAVSIDGDYAIVGTPNYDTNGILDSGAAYIYKRFGAAWIQQAKLIASDVTTYAFFGNSVSISGDYVVIGASGNYTGRSGTAYIFKREGDFWIQQQKLDAEFDDFAYGSTVSIDGEYIIIGSPCIQIYDLPGTAYVYKREGDIWSLQTKLSVADHPNDSHFGKSVAIHGNYAIIGANDYAEDPQHTAAYTGCAFIFRRTGEVWTKQARLVASEDSLEKSFGNSVAIHDEYVIVGAEDTEYEDLNSGTAYIFKRDGTVWTQQAMLVGENRTEFDNFGFSVAINGKHAVVGAPWTLPPGNYSWDGAVYFYRQDENGWQRTEIAYCYCRSGGDSASYEFGRSLATDGFHTIVGTPNNAPLPWDEERIGVANIYRLVDTLVTLRAEPDEIVIGQSATLSWTAINTGSVTIDQIVDSVDDNGSVVVMPDQSTVYTITATDPDGTDTDTDSVTINVIDPPIPPVVNFNALETWIEPGDSTKIWWETKYADGCSITPGNLDIDLMGSLEISPDVDTIYTLTASGPGGITTESIAVKVAYFPPTVEITAGPQAIQVGESSTLSWTSTRAQTASMDQGINSIDVNGFTTVAPESNTTYTITVTGLGGTVTDSVTVFVVDPSVPPTVNISTDSQHIEPGGNATLTWISTNADTCIIEPEPGGVAPGGSVVVSPEFTTQYVITASGPAGIAAASVIVGVGTVGQTHTQYEYDAVGRIKKIIRRQLP